MTKVKRILMTLGRNMKTLEVIMVLALLALIAIILIFNLSGDWLILISSIMFLGIALTFMAEAVGRYPEKVVIKNKLINILLADTSIVTIILSVICVVLLNLLPKMQWYVVGIICILAIILTVIIAYIIASYFEKKIIQ